MYPHHQASIERVTDYFRQQPGVQALLLGGSIAHGFARESSDVDIMIIVSADEHRRRLQEHDLTFFNRELVTYDDGYVDGKYLSMDFLAQVEQRGSEPARFAFADAQILFSDLPELEAHIRRIAQYPVHEKADRIRRFVAQLSAWNWFVGEAVTKQNPYLLNVAVTKLLLFGGRLILAHNELLYPYHKWLFNVLEQAADKPDKLLDTMRNLSRSPSQAGATEFYNLIANFRAWESDGERWGNRFMLDSELTWMDGTTPIDDI